MLYINPDQSCVLRAPVGKWRIVEFERPTDAQILTMFGELAHQPPDLEERVRGRVRSVRDYDVYHEASIEMTHVRPGLRRSLFNDAGMEILAITSGTEGIYEAGPES